MRPVYVAAVLFAMLTVACGPVPNTGTLRDAFFSRIVHAYGISDFSIDRDRISFHYLGDDYSFVVTQGLVEPFDDQRYTHIGTVDCDATINGQRLEHCDRLRRHDIELDAIVALWDNEGKRWRFDMEF